MNNVKTAHPAMIMAGGSGARMRDSGIDTPKALVPVGGVPLLEWNTRQLLRFGFREIAVVVPAGSSDLAEFAQRTLAPLVGGLGGAFKLIKEGTPLGNMGAVQLTPDPSRPLLVVYADNLTALDLGAISERHSASDAAMTIATHRQPFTMPFGDLQLNGSQVLAYVEKPTIHFTVCSAISVLSPTAIAAVVQGEALGISQLVNRLISRDMAVESFPHDALWIDINDSVQVARAEAMIASAPEQFGLTMS